jgi:acyl carrier protein
MNARTNDEIRTVFFDVLGAIAPEADPAAIDAGKPLREQIDLDSMDWLNVIIRLHEVLGVDIPEKDYGELTTLNATVNYLVRRCAATT